MAGTGADFDGAESVFDNVRRLFAMARFDPESVSPDRLVDGLESTGGRYRRVIAAAVAHYARRDPTGIAAERERLLEVLDEYDDETAASLARAVGETVVVDRSAVDPLVDRLAPGGRPAAAAAGLVVAADHDSGAIAGHVPALLDALGGDPDARDRVAEVLAALILADVESDDGPIRPRVSRSLDDGDAAGAARVLCLAAAEGHRESADEIPRVFETLDGAAGSRLAATDGPVVATVLSSLREVAAGSPHLLVPHVGCLLEFSVADGGIDLDADRAVSEVLTDVAAASPPVYERLFDELDADEGWISQVRSVAGDGSRRTDRAAAALSGAATDRVDVLERREERIRTLLDRRPGLGADLVAALARERPAAVEWAIDPLLEATDPDESSGDRERVADALGVLARDYPPVAGTVVDRLATREEGRDGAVVACRAIAEHAPASLVGTTGPDGTPVAKLLVEELSTEGRATTAASALSTLGIYYPSALEPVADDVANALRASSYSQVSERHRALNVLAGVAVHAAPETMHNVGLTVLDQVQQGERIALLEGEAGQGLVVLLGALCCEFDRYAEQLVGWLDEVDAEHRPRLLEVFAEGAWPGRTALANHLPTLADATHRLDDADRAVATSALASAVGAASDPPTAATARLTDLIYDFSPDVRRWATYGVGEWLATTGATHEEPVKRLRLVADAGDDGPPVADLALVRAGERSGADCVEALAEVARSEYRAVARTAVAELAAVDDPAARDALDDVAAGHDDAWVRASARRVVEERSDDSQ